MSAQRKRAARFRVVGLLDMAGSATEGTVTIEDGLFTVRPLRRHKTYTLPLSTVADIVCQRMVRAELLQKQKEKAAIKKLRRKRP